MTYSTDVLQLNPELAAATAYRLKPERLLRANDGFDSQLERDFDAELRTRFGVVLSHAWTFHLPGGVDYTPDFVAFDEFLPAGERVLVRDHEVAVFEVKGSLRQKNARDSRTRFKIAAGLYPFTFVWVTRRPSGQWLEKTILPSRSLP